jgi:hypothetical protein
MTKFENNSLLNTSFIYWKTLPDKQSWSLQTVLFKNNVIRGGSSLLMKIEGYSYKMGDISIKDLTVTNTSSDFTLFSLSEFNSIIFQNTLFEKSNTRQVNILLEKIKGVFFNNTLFNVSQSPFVLIKQTSAVRFEAFTMKNCLSSISACLCILNTGMKIYLFLKIN